MRASFSRQDKCPELERIPAPCVMSSRQTNCMENRIARQTTQVPICGRHGWPVSRHRHYRRGSPGRDGTSFGVYVTPPQLAASFISQALPIILIGPVFERQFQLVVKARPAAIAVSGPFSHLPVAKRNGPSGGKLRPPWFRIPMPGAAWHHW